MLHCHSLQALQEIDHRASHGFAVDVLKGCTKSEALGSRQKSRQVHPRAITLTVFRRVASEEVGYGHSQRRCQLFKDVWANTVDAPFVFLNLLKCHI